MGRDTYKRHHPVSDITKIDAGSDDQQASNAINAKQPDDESTNWNDPVPVSTTSDDDRDKSSKGDQSTLPGIAKGYLTGSLIVRPKNLIGIIVVSYIFLTCFMYVQDNGLSKLDTLQGIANFGLKLIPITVLLLLLVIILVIINVCSNRNSKKRKPKKVTDKA